MSFGGMAISGNVRPSTQVEIVEAFIAKVRAGVSSLGNESTCFISDREDPSQPVNQNTFATVVVGNGQFNQGVMDGSGNLGVQEVFSLTLTVFSMISLDSLEHAHYAILDGARGQLPLKKAVLRTLAGKNLDGGTYNGQPCLLLLESMFPRTATHQTRRIDDETFASFSLAFDVSFWWDLGEGSLLT